MNRVIVSGASGLIGAHVSEYLIQRGDIEEIILLYFRHCPKAGVRKNVKFIKCDLRSDEDVRKAIETIGKSDKVLGIHCAADVSWTKSLEEITGINIGGSLNFSRMLNDTSNHVSFLYLSTAYTSTVNWDYKNGYEESKALAERQIRRTYPQFDFHVFSFSLVVGSSTDGFIDNFREGLYPLIKCMFIYDIPFLVGRKDCKLDIIPLNWVVGELKHVIDKLLTNNSCDINDVVATAGVNRITIENLVTVIVNSINYYRRYFGMTEKPVPSIISYRRWQFLKRSIESWDLKKEVPKDIRFLEKLMDSYRFYIENDTVASPRDISCISPDPDSYLSKVIGYWFESNKEIVYKKWDLKISKAVS